jgi:hypothetical protein
VVGVVVVEEDLRPEARRAEARAEVILDERRLLGGGHQHARVVARVERLVLHGDRVDRDPSAFIAWMYFTKYWAYAG